MKKRLMCLIIALAMAMSCLGGCTFLYEAGVIRVDNEKAYNLSVATVTYMDKTVEVTRGELVEVYNAQGYQYVESYGYTVKDACDLLINQLANQKIIRIWGESQSVAGSKDGLTIATLLNAEKNEGVKTINETLRTSYDQYLDVVLKEMNISKVEGESNVDKDRTARALPTIEEEEFDREEYVSADIAETDIDKSFFVAIQEEIASETNAKVQKAMKLALSRLTAVLCANYYLDTAEECYDYLLNKQLIGMVDANISDHIKSLSPDEEATIDSKVLAAYELYKDTQKQKYDADETKLGSDVAAYLETLVYVPTSGYGEVKNVLIQFTDEQNARYKAYKAKGYSDEDNLAFRDNLAKEITVKFSSVDFYDWYDNCYDEDDYDDTHILYDWRDVVVEQSGATITEDMSIDAFMLELKADLESASDYAGKLKVVDNYIYGYGEDTGMFNAKNDYVISPVDSENSWVEEFTELGQALCGGYDDSEEYKHISKANLITGNWGEVGATGWVVTDYGVHIIYVTKIIGAEVDADNYITLDTVINLKTGKTLREVIKDGVVGTMQNHKTTAFENDIFETNKDDFTIVYHPENWEDIALSK